MSICPKCSAYYGSDSSAFCLADGTPLVTVDPGSDNWSEGSRAIEEKKDALRKQQRKLMWRRVLMGTMLIATIVVCALAINRWTYLETVHPEPTASPSPSPSPLTSPSPSPPPNTKSSSTPTPTPVHKISGQVTSNGKPLNGVNITLKGAKAASTTTDQNGNYRFSDLAAGGSYTITPDRPKTDFTPGSRSV